MIFYLDKSLVGSRTDFKVTSEDGFSVLVEKVPSSGSHDQSHLWINRSSLDELSKLFLTPLESISFEHFISDPSRNFLKAQEGVLGKIPVESVPWSLALPGEAYRAALSDLSKALCSKVLLRDDKALKYYTTTFRETNKVFEYLRPAKLSVEDYHKGVQGGLVDAIFRSFRPSELGGEYCDVPVYSRLETVTGRPKTLRGPKILNASKDIRERLIGRSRWGEHGKIVSLDFKSLEPRLVCAINGVSPPEDIYLDIKETLFSDHPKISREVVKSTVISQLYGSTKELCFLGESEVGSIREYFGMDSLQKRLLSEYEANGREFIHNYYGRIVSTVNAKPYMLINYYTQSSGVDVSLYGFLSVLRYLEYLGRLEDVVPLFLLHDAIFLDVHESALRLLPSLCKVGSNDIPGLENFRFYLQPQNLVYEHLTPC